MYYGLNSVINVKLYLIEKMTNLACTYALPVGYVDMETCTNEFHLRLMTFRITHEFTLILTKL